MAPSHSSYASPYSAAPAPRSGSSRSRRWLLGGGSVLGLALGLTVVASAQSQSPFASKKRPAWEQPQATQPVQSAPAPQAPSAATPTYQAPSYQAPSYQAPARPAPAVPLRSYGSTAPAASAPTDWSTYQPTPAQPDYASIQVPAPQPAPDRNMLPEGYSYQRSITGQAADQAFDYGAASPDYAQPAPAPAQIQAPANSPYSFGTPAPQQVQAQPGPYGAPQSGPYAPPQTGPQSGPRSGPQAGPISGPMAAPRKRSLAERLGLRNLQTLLTGGVRGGVAARDADGWEEAFVGDADIEFEVGAITDGGLEYGVNLQTRLQYDEGRRGFARRLPDCPPTLAGCASVLVDGTPVALRGHTSQFYTSGPDVADDVQIALESAHLFLRSAYGDVTLGRDDGSAYLFSLGAPSLLNVGASNSPVDYTGLDAVKTVNDASGFAEKVTYTSPRLLGDQIGVGVQFGVSYAPDAEVCGVDYCVDADDIPGVLTPDLEDVIEAGLSLDRTFANGLSVEGTVTYARASEQLGLAGFDDLESLGAGVEVRLQDWTVGGSWLNSNQGLLNGDYEAYDVGVTWKPGPLGFTAGYGRATDDLVGLKSDQITGGVTYDVNSRITVGAGVQHADRESVRSVGGVAVTGREKATALFIEGGFTF